MPVIGCDNLCLDVGKAPRVALAGRSVEEFEWLAVGEQRQRPVRRVLLEQYPRLAAWQRCRYEGNRMQLRSLRRSASTDQSVAKR
jgi:hypothetical protein